MSVDLSGFVSAGYFVARLSERKPWMASDLLPERILSGCDCICTFFPDDWAIDWTSCSPAERSSGAAAFRIPEHRRADVMAWATSSFEKAFGWPRVLYSLHDAEAARALLDPTLDDVALFALGLPEGLATAFLASAAPPPRQEGYAPVGATGYFECVSRGERLAEGGSALGYELLSTWMGLITHSWLCNGLEKQLHEKSGLVPNPHGFVADLDTARDCVNRIRTKEVKGEPEDWYPWLVVKYG